MAKHDVTLVTVAGFEPGEQAAVDALAKQGVDIHAVRRAKPKGWQRWQRRWNLASRWLGHKTPWRTVWFWDPQIQRVLDELLTQHDFDLVIVEDNAMGVYSYPTSVPKLFTEHEVRRSRKIDTKGIKDQNLFAWAFQEIDWQRWKTYQKTVWGKFDRIQVFTSRDAEAIAVLAPDLAYRVRVNPFGINLPVPLDPAGRDKRTILFTGNFTHPPNVDAALWLGKEIMPILREALPGIKLWLIGIYPPSAIRELACEDIQVPGMVPDIEPYFDRAALIVAPVRIGGGMRMKVLQAMALGKAVVTTSRGAEGLTINGNTPPLEICDDPSGFAQSIVRLLKDDDARIEMGLRSREYVEDHLSAQAYTARIESIYAEMKVGEHC